MKAWFSHWFKRLKTPKGDPVTYFVHVPKTAGTSFIVLLDRFFHQAKIFPQQLWREVKAIEQNKNQKFDLFRGHFGGGGLHVLTDRPIDYMTILRNPIDLARSTYQYVRREENTKVHELVTEKQMSFTDFLQHTQTQPLIKNRMIRNVSFDFNNDPAAQEVFLSEETIDYLQTIMAKSSSNLNDDDRLTRAKAFLSSCRWFGLQEEFDRSMQLLCFMMQWPPIGPSQRLNVFNQKATLSDDEISTLMQINKQDIAFYEFARGLFEKKYTNMTRVLEKKYSNPDLSTDELIDLNYQDNHVSKLKSFIKYGFDEVLLGSQWHRRELMQPENEYFRWTGPKSVSTIDFWLKPKSYEIKIRIINAVSVEMLNELEIKLNGKTIEWHTEDKGIVRVLNLNCNTGLIQTNGLARLKINTTSVKSHAEAFESDDQRLVGIAVHWIQFKHV